MSTTISPVFTGVSSFANDLQNVIDRSVAIASMPLKQLQNQLTDLNRQSSALSGLTDVFDALTTATQALSEAIGPGGLSGESSDPKAVSVLVSGAAGTDSYTVEVVDAGASSTSISSASLPAVSDPASQSISSSSMFTLTVNGKAYELSPSQNLNALAQAVNSAGAGVKASLINIGGAGSTNYRLVIRSDSLAADAIQLNDGSQDLLEALNTGKPAQCRIDGLSVTTTSSTATLAPGVSIRLLRQTAPDEPVTITVSRDDACIHSAVYKFIDAYNSAVDAVDQQIGEHAGVLSGQSIVYVLRRSLSSITQYTNAGPVSSLASMGVELDKNGRLSLNSAKFDERDPADVQTFLGGADSSGFLYAASQALSALDAPLDGDFSIASKLLNEQIATQNDVIADNQRRVDDLQTALQQQMSAADALLSQLEAKKTYFNNLFTAMMNYNLNGAGVKAG